MGVWINEVLLYCLPFVPSTQSSPLGLGVGREGAPRGGGWRLGRQGRYRVRWLGAGRFPGVNWFPGVTPWVEGPC